MYDVRVMIKNSVRLILNLQLNVTDLIDLKVECTQHILLGNL